ncbi:AAA family ATPase [Verminephrobacter eiseniae]|uniref:AAA family ATPase n=1 Tax=Verminephrobacter eiseniae TaxID=364317 RepID=UPI002238A628|nr:AAA family ATPase [Verminephrobacter eiseniae]
MKIRHLVLNNFRKYDSARFNFNERFSVLIGNNGAGKTTILDALAIMLNTYFQGSGIRTGSGVIKKDDARLIITEKGDQTFQESKQDVWLQASATIDGITCEWRRDKGDRGRLAKEFVDLGAEARAKIKEGQSPNLPVFLYYGAGRLWDVHRDIKTEKPGSQLDAYRHCLDPMSDQNSFEKWFKKMAFSGIQKKRPIPALDAVKDAVMCCIPGAEDFYHDVDKDHIMIKLEREGFVPFNYLSDGYRNMVAMVADIAHRAARLNPQHGADVAKETMGVVLIDEIDLHLHPKWQRRVVPDLQCAFPNLQFIATTHSPFILQSLGPHEVIDLDQQVAVEELKSLPIGIAAPGPKGEFSNRAIEDIVESVMGVNIPQRGQRYQKMYDAAKEYYDLLQQAQSADEQQKKVLKIKLDELSSPFSDNVAYHAFLEMERLAAGLESTNSPESGNASR